MNYSEVELLREYVQMLLNSRKVLTDRLKEVEHLISLSEPRCKHEYDSKVYHRDNKLVLSCKHCGHLKIKK